jgi:hypothetical protein
MVAIVRPESDYHRDRIDTVCNFFSSQEKNCMKTATLIGKFLNDFEFYNCAQAIKCSKIATTFFVLPELSNKFNIWRKNTTDYLNGEEVSVKEVLTSTGNFSNKICELGKFLNGLKILPISSVLLKKVSFINGVSLMIGISGQIQHRAGMLESSMVISINNDKNAPLNKVAK